MTFRDDHDAALARADALADELEVERKKAEAQRKELEAERAERRRLEALLADRREPLRTSLRDDQFVMTGEPEAFDVTQFMLVALLVIACLLFAIALVMA